MPMNQDQIRERIAEFPRWHYKFDLDGQLTPIFDPGSINRHAQRERYFFEPLVRLMGGSLQGKRVLDLGCNAGFWSLSAMEAGCDFVLGVDGRQMHIDQANFVFEVKGIDKSRYRFSLRNVSALDPAEIGTFDIVLCLGLLYHVNKPMSLFEMISRVNSDLLVVDTDIEPSGGSWIRIAHENTDEPRNAVDQELIMLPTREAVFDMTRQVGYKIVCLRPEFTDYEGAGDFRNGARRAFICSKTTDLAPLATASETLAEHRRRGLLRSLARRVPGARAVYRMLRS